MILYADRDNLTAWLGGAPDEDDVYLNMLLRRASVLVRKATANDLYDVLPSGLPEDVVLQEALRDATTAQCEAWLANEIDPSQGVSGLQGAVLSSQIDAATVQFHATAAELSTQAKAWLVTHLDGVAVEVLRNAGLASPYV